MKRTYPTCPIVAVSSVILWNDKVLLAKRGTEPSVGQWNLPGGVVELGEHHREALKREVYEETGLQIIIHDLVEVHDRIIKDDLGQILYHYLILDYWSEPINPTQARAGSDVAAVMWSPIYSVQDMVTDSLVTEAIMRAVKERDNLELSDNM